ncbi:DNA-binding response regulator [Polaribacter reichenbachii]|uniref:Two-component system response regulator n=1 Tax=Polaribacter reichenbachii TaxID=996801 RepID=A0A1B8U1N1_9FLAO|nr:LytTR family DNA-binding domain-containing protein [Polaribacter reichenbachii]APZ47343.1 DNA-binding response regulator [Polaribacter reichenbachii]AUC17984.1 DNA-binding response regulator [Polaribacter reichenbachii]OBY65689.1 two-component system response regulator [Polaribacter reichenbachii]
MIRYLIIDDEPMAHTIIKKYCALLPNLEFKASCYDAIEALLYLNAHEIDLIFLDLNMPKLKGFEFLKTLANPPKVIVTTAYSEFAIDGYALNVVDYLLKPFSFERFLSAINKVISSNATSLNHDSNSDTLSVKKHIFLKQHNSYVQVELASILFIEASGNYTKVVTDRTTISIREKISDTLAMLTNRDFIQVHKSFAVAKKHITSIEGNRIYIQDYVVPVGKMYKGNVNGLFGG